MTKILLVQWGRKGAGPKLLLQIALQLKNRGNEVQVSFCRSNEYSEDFFALFKNETIDLNIPNKLCLVSPIHVVINRIKYLDAINRFRPELVVFVMPHPWDILFGSRFRTARVIHDAIRHPGDSIWPTSASFKRRAKLPDEIIVLSEAVKMQLLKFTTNLHLASHPILNFSSRTKLPLRSLDVLVIGRQKKYKGTAILAEVWPEVLKSHPKAILTIAGQGKIPKKVKLLKNANVINKWLSDSEIDELLKSAKCVLFPYVEASQSGLLPAATALGAQIIVTPVGGLVEQARQFDGIISHGIDPASIADAIVTALSNDALLKKPVPSGERLDLGLKVEEIATHGKLRR